MNDIIQCFLDEGVEKIKREFSEIAIGHKNFSGFTKELNNELRKLGTDICRKLLEELDEQIKRDKNRQKKWIVERKEDKKTLLTLMGNVEYKRTYYTSKRGKRYEYLVDKVVGIEEHQRVDEEVESEIIESAINVSYEKSGKPYDISKTTVMSKIKKLEEIDRIDKKLVEKKEVTILYIEADEDHVSLQKGGIAEPKLIYIHEGYEDIVGHSQRRKLKNVHYISGIYRTDEIWEKVREYIEITYKTEFIKKVYITGDGAAYIKKGTEYIDNSVFVLDRYHINSYILKCTGHEKKYRSKLWEGINKCRKKAVLRTMDELLTTADSTYRAEAIIGLKKYIENNWAGIRIYKTDSENIVGCSAEGHISHLLSARLSSRPLGWSDDGVDNMAQLRAYNRNGGKVINIIRANKSHKISDLPEGYIDGILEAMKEKTLDKVVGMPAINIGIKTQLYRALNILRHIDYDF